jgi:hypothetical protein
MVCVGHSQTTDTICFPVPVAQRVLIAAEQKKILDTVVMLQNQRIDALKAAFKDLKEKDSVSQADNLKIIAEKDIQIDLQDKIARKEKRKAFWRGAKVGAAGAAVTAGAVYLFIKQ